MVQLTVKSRSKKIKEFNSNYFPADTPVANLVNTIASKNAVSVHRLRLTRPQDGETTGRPKQIALNLEKSLAGNGLPSGEDNAVTLYVKDLGPQISWRTVFVLEYLGPLLIHPLFFFYFGGFSAHSTTQTLSFVLVILHFLKREYETIYVHKFSLSTMPLFNLFKNSSHYWLLSGLNLAYFIYSPNALPTNLHSLTTPAWKKILFHTAEHSSSTTAILVSLWAYAEVSNFITHINLSGLRKPGSTERKIPFGYGFTLVSFPNYFFESLSWLLFAFLNNNPFAYLFLVIGSLQMLVWAAKKHKRYLKDFGDKYPRNRKIFIPFIY